MTTRVDRVVLDTNILLTATAPKRPRHRAALRLLEELPGRGVTLCVCGQILREYLCVATRPPAANGLGLTTPDALANVDSFVQRMRLLDEDRRVFRVLRALLSEVACGGKQIHDANIVALMLRYGVLQLLTQNPADFQRFGDRVELRTLDDTDSWFPAASEPPSRRGPE